MSNRINMLVKGHLMEMFNLGWSDRKINSVTGIHRLTIARYRKESRTFGKHASDIADQEVFIPKVRDSADQRTIPDSQSVPFNEKQVPPDKVVHFEVPTDSDISDQKLPISKSGASVYHLMIQEKMTLGQNARSIYQDLVIEKGYSGSYDSVKRYIRKLRNCYPKLYARIETAPGEEGQVDFGEGAPTQIFYKLKEISITSTQISMNLMEFSITTTQCFFVLCLVLTPDTYNLFAKSEDPTKCKFFFIDQH